MRLLKIRDSVENVVLERHFVDAQEILKSDPERFKPEADDASVDFDFMGNPVTARATRIHMAREVHSKAEDRRRLQAEAANEEFFPEPFVWDESKAPKTGKAKTGKAAVE